MIVTSSRYAAILYKEQMDKISGPESTVIISGDHNDTQEYHEFTDKNKHKKQIDDYKKPFDQAMVNDVVFINCKRYAFNWF